MGFFTSKTQPVHQEMIGTLPSLPTFDTSKMSLPTLEKYQKLAQKEYTPVTALANALLGEDVAKLYSTDLKINSTDTEALRASKKALRQKYYDTLTHMYDTANTFVDKLSSVDGIFGMFMRQMNKINHQVQDTANTISSSIGGQKETRNPDQAVLNDMFHSVEQVKRYMDEKITLAYEQQKQELAAELGEEGKNSSYGAWRRAFLETAYANRLVESDYQIITQESGRILDNALKQMELTTKPLLMQMNAMQQSLTAELEGAKQIEEEVSNEANRNLQKEIAEKQLELQRTEGIARTKREQEALNLEKQKMEQDRITQQNLLAMQREQNINQLKLEQGRLAFQKELENLKSKHYYDNLNFSAQQKNIDNLLAKTQINNDARYRIWQTANTRKPSVLGQVLGGIAQIGGGLLLGGKILPAIGQKLGFGADTISKVASQGVVK